MATRSINTKSRFRPQLPTASSSFLDQPTDKSSSSNTTMNRCLTFFSIYNSDLPMRCTLRNVNHNRDPDLTVESQRTTGALLPRFHDLHKGFSKAPIKPAISIESNNSAVAPGGHLSTGRNKSPESTQCKLNYISPFRMNPRHSVP